MRSAAVIGLALLAACGSGSAVAPSSAAGVAAYIGTSAIPVAGAQPKLRARPGFPAIVPEATGKTYEYIFNQYGTYASIFNYPKSTAQIGEIAGDGGQGCTNVLYGYGKKIIWNVGGPQQINEYQVPKKLLKTLTVNYSFASSCAMNTAGDLAVGILEGSQNNKGAGDVVIFKNASGTGKAYPTPLTAEFFDGYDPKGNLFADGYGANYGFAFVELPKGSKKGVTIATSNSPNFPGSVQWDGTYVTVFDQITSDVYQYSISGTTATLKGTVQLAGAGDCAQTWIVKGLIYCGDAGLDGGEVFKYPAGGTAIATFTGNFVTPLGVTAAQK